MNYMFRALYFRKITITSNIAHVAEKENLNIVISKLLKVPIIGCASHALDLAVNKFLPNYEIIMAIMLKKRTLKKVQRYANNLKYCHF